MSWFVLLFVSIGTAYLLVSVGVSIYRRRHAVPSGDPLGAVMTSSELHSCYDELEDVTEGLQKHLENFHHLLGDYDPDVAKRWADEGSVWRRTWEVLGRRCRFDQIRGTAHRKEFEEMAAVYDEMGQTQQIYTSELKRFGTNQAPRLRRIRDRMQRIGVRLAQPAGAANGENHE